MKCKISAHFFEGENLGWTWYIDMLQISIEPYGYYKTKESAIKGAIRWCKRFKLDYKIETI